LNGLKPRHHRDAGATGPSEDLGGSAGHRGEKPVAIFRGYVPEPEKRSNEARVFDSRLVRMAERAQEAVSSSCQNAYGDPALLRAWQSLHMNIKGLAECRVFGG
jgi:hypothetical protein